MSAKYPRTAHLPWSPGGTSDDRRISSVESFLCTPVVLSEKMDGSNVCLERDACFARSHASAPSHPSFDALKAFHSAWRWLIDPGVQVFGEWLYAKHSIAYDKLPTYLMVFAVRNTNRTYFGEKGLWASWEEVELWANTLGVASVPVLAKVVLTNESELRALVETHAKDFSRVGKEREGVVVRVAREFKDSEFETSVAKYVRSNHVQTDDHWKSQPIVRNILL